MPYRSILSLALIFGLFFAPARAGERLDFLFDNETEFEITEIVIDMEQESGAPRRSSSFVNMQPGAGYRIGIQGVVKALRIRLTTVAGVFDFGDLSAFADEEALVLRLAAGDGRGVFLDEDGGAKAVGTDSAFITPYSCGYAVDWLQALNATDLDDIRDLLAERVDETGNEREQRELEAGPIWNNDHAKTRCPEVADEWNANRDDGTPPVRWTGNWVTTVPGEMSVCGCESGGVSADDLLFSFGDGEKTGYTAAFGETYGMGFVEPVSPGSDEWAISVQFGADGGAALESVFDTLLRHGGRPLVSNLERRSGDWEPPSNWLESGDGPVIAFEKLLAAYVDAREDGTLRDYSVLIVSEGTFQEALKGEDISPAPAFMVMCGGMTVRIVKTPDCSELVPQLL